MSKTAHTPGPWEGQGEDGTWLQDHDWSANNDSASRTMFVPIHADGKVVALVVREDWDDDQIEADACLIASAPDLLQELKNIANADTAEWDDPSEYEAWAKSRARFAIAKALGEQS